MRVLTPLVPLSLALLVLPVGVAEATLEYEYVTAPTLSVPIFKTNVALCDDPKDLCVGGARFPTNLQNALASTSDDVYGSNAPLLLCVWAPDGDENCSAEDAYTPVGCGPQILLGIPFYPTQGVVYLYAAHVSIDLEVCFASTGRLVVSTW